MAGVPYKRFIVCKACEHEYVNAFVASFKSLDKAIRDGRRRIAGREELGFEVFDCDERRFVHSENMR